MKRKEMLLAARDNAEIARDARWLLPSLNRLGYNEMTLLVQQIGEDLDNIHYFVENGDETFTNSMDGEDGDEEEREFRFAFLELEAELEDIQGMFSEYSGWSSGASAFVDLMNKKESAILRGEYDNEDDDYTTCRAYDDCTVALIGKRYNFGVDGYDVYERDVFGLDSDSGEYASEQAKERLMKLTKKDMVDLIGTSVSIMLRFQAFYVRYQLMTQTFERIRGVNMETLNLMKDINAAYEDLAPELERNCRYGRHDYEYMYIYGTAANAAVRRFDSLLEKLPDRFWVE